MVVLLVLGYDVAHLLARVLGRTYSLVLLSWVAIVAVVALDPFAALPFEPKQTRRAGVRMLQAPRDVFSPCSLKGTCSSSSSTDLPAGWEPSCNPTGRGCTKRSLLGGFVGATEVIDFSWDSTWSAPGSGDDGEDATGRASGITAGGLGVRFCAFPAPREPFDGDLEAVGVCISESSASPIEDASSSTSIRSRSAGDSGCPCDQGG